MSQASEHLKNCADVGDLKRELRSLCARFGSIMRLDVLMARQGGKRRALCFWRMESAQHEEEVMSEFGVGRFGGDLVVIVDLQAQDVLNGRSESAPVALSGGGSHGVHVSMRLPSAARAPAAET